MALQDAAVTKTTPLRAPAAIAIASLLSFVFGACAAPPPENAAPVDDLVKPADNKPDDKKPDDNKPDDKKPDDKKPDDKKPGDVKPDPKPKTPPFVLPDKGNTAPCLTIEDIYVKRVWAPFMSTTCGKCHQPIGMAKDTKFVLRPASESDAIERNIEMLTKLAKFDVDGVPVLLLKPTNAIDHAGGKVLEKDSEEYKALQLFIDRIENPVACVKPPSETFFNGVELTGPQATLRKASLNLVGRVPTESEMETVEDSGLKGVGLVVDQLMTTDAFIRRVKELYADIFLQGRYDRYNNAVNLVDGAKFKDRMWYELARYNNPQIYGSLVAGVNRGVARQATELVGHIVKNNRPFSEVLTADYTMTNAYAARSYGLYGIGYKDGQDPKKVDANAFFPVKLPGLPHAGVLTTPAWLARFPTTPTNRNRHRALKIYEQFLATDVLAQEDRPTDVTSISGFNPTMYNPQCAICHSIVDPIAGTMQNWDSAGRYMPPKKGWHQDMRPPGFSQTTMPFTQSHQAARWLGKQIASDPRFALSTIHTAYKLLTGNEPLKMPTDTEAKDFGPRLRAYDAQHDDFQAIAKSFIKQNGNFKVAIKGVVLSRWFRARNVAKSEQPRIEELKHVGTAELLTPEQLDRKITALLGFSWQKSAKSAHLLRPNGSFYMLYGGMDGDAVESRVRVPSGIMTALVERMANEMACRVVPREMKMAAGSRKLLPVVTLNTVPETEDGKVDAQAEALIRANIQHLHAHLLGESLDASSPEIDATWQLFRDTWLETSADPKGTLPGACHVTKDFATNANLPKAQRLTNDDNGTVRAWMAVVSYLLTDYRFTHQ